MKTKILFLFLLIFILLCKKKDIEPPSVKILKPIEGESFFPDTIEIKIKAEDNRGVDYIEAFVDGKSLGTKSGGNVTFKWDATAEKDSSEHVVYARAVDFSGNVGRSKDVNFLIFSGNHPPLIELIFPDSGAILTSYTCTLQYRGIDKDTFDTLFYTIHIDTIPYPIFKEPIAENIRDTFFVLDYLLPDKKFYWQVVVSDLLGKKDTSKVYCFQTPPENNPPSPPSNPSPQVGDTTISVLPQLSFYSYDPDGDSIYFRVKLDTINQFSMPVLDTLVSDSSIVLTDSLIPGVRYFWYVIAYDEKGNSSTSNPWYFYARKAELQEMYSESGVWFKDAKIYKDTIFVIESPDVLKIYANNYGNLTLLNSFTLPSFSYRVYYNPPYLFVTYGTPGPNTLGVYKKSGTDFNFLDEFNLNSGSISEILFYNQYIYLVTIGDFKILKLNSDTLELIKTINIDFTVYDADISFSNLYLVGDNYLEGYYLSPPDDPSFLFKKTTGYSNLKSISIYNRFVVIAADNYLLLFYISDPFLAPILLKQKDITQVINNIKVKDRYFGIFGSDKAYIIFPNIINIYNFSKNFSSSLTIESGDISYPYFVVCSQDGLYVLKCIKY